MRWQAVFQQPCQLQAHLMLACAVFVLAPSKGAVAWGGAHASGLQPCCVCSADSTCLFHLFLVATRSFHLFHLCPPVPLFRAAGAGSRRGCWGGGHQRAADRHRLGAWRGHVSLDHLFLVAVWILFGGGSWQFGSRFWLQQKTVWLPLASKCAACRSCSRPPPCCCCAHICAYAAAAALRAAPLAALLHWLLSLSSVPMCPPHLLCRAAWTMPHPSRTSSSTRQSERAVAFLIVHYSPVQ